MPLRAGDATIEETLLSPIRVVVQASGLGIQDIEEAFAMTSRGRLALLLSFLALSLSTTLIVKPLKAQVLYGSILGTVTDPNGAVLPRAHITVTNPKTGLKRETDTDSAGLYTLPNLPAGTYRLTAVAQGFKEYSQTDLEVTVGAQVRADLA